MADKDILEGKAADVAKDVRDLSDDDKAELLQVEKDGQNRKTVLRALGGEKAAPRGAKSTDSGYKEPVNTEEVDALQRPKDERTAVDLTSSPNPQLEATRKAAARADREAEGPISGTGAHRLAAPAPAVVPGAPAEHSDPQRHDARRTAPIAPPAPTRGPAVEK